MPEKMSPQQSLQNYVDRQGRLGQLATLMGLDWMNRYQERHGRNEEAENVWYRKQMGVESGDVEQEDDMRNVQLGDNYHPAPVVVQPPNSNSLATALMAAILGGGLGVGGYMLGSRGGSNDPDKPEFETESVTMGLGRIEDYLKDDP